MSEMTPKNIQNLIPAQLIHPGEILLDELQARGVSQAEMARMLQVKRSQLNEYIKGKRDFNHKLCLLIAEALDMDEDIWLNLMHNYETDKARKDILKQRKEMQNSTINNPK